MEISRFEHINIKHPILYSASVMSPEYAVLNVIPFLDTLQFEGSFLEIGAGTGVNSLHIAELGKCSVVSVEIDDNACTLFEENIKLWKQQKNIEVIHQDFNDFSQAQSNKFETIFSAPPYFLNFQQNNNKDFRYFTDRYFFENLVSFSKKNLNKNGRLILHLNSFITFHFVEKLLLDSKFTIVERNLPSILDVRDFFAVNEFLLNQYFEIDTFEFTSRFPRGKGQNTFNVNFSQALGYKDNGWGGWIIAVSKFL